MTPKQELVAFMHRIGKGRPWTKLREEDYCRHFNRVVTLQRSPEVHRYQTRIRRGPR